MKGRITKARVAAAFGLALVVFGLGLLVLPYDTTVEIPAPPGSYIDDAPIEARCEAPLLDAVHGEPEGWLNYAPDTGTTVDHGDDLTGSWCSPTSVYRGGTGALLVFTGLAAIAITAILAKRRTEPTEASEPAGPISAAD